MVEHVHPLVWWRRLPETPFYPLFIVTVTVVTSIHSIAEFPRFPRNVFPETGLPVNGVSVNLRPVAEGHSFSDSRILSVLYACCAL